MKSSWDQQTEKALDGLAKSLGEELPRGVREGWETVRAAPQQEEARDALGRVLVELACREPKGSPVRSWACIAYLSVRGPKGFRLVLSQMKESLCALAWDSDLHEVGKLVNEVVCGCFNEDYRRRALFQRINGVIRALGQMAESLPRIGADSPAHSVGRPPAGRRTKEEREGLELKLAELMNNDLGATDRELADKVGVSKSTIQDWCASPHTASLRSAVEARDLRRRDFEDSRRRPRDPRATRGDPPLNTQDE